MAVPKRRQSNSQSKMRTMHWRRKALDAARVALSLGKSLTTRKAKGFYYKPCLIPNEIDGLFKIKDLEILSFQQDHGF